MKFNTGDLVQSTRVKSLIGVVVSCDPKTLFESVGTIDPNGERIVRVLSSKGVLKTCFASQLKKANV